MESNENNVQLVHKYQLNQIITNTKTWTKTKNKQKSNTKLTSENKYKK
jgi:hypothetical protein